MTKKFFNVCLLGSLLAVPAVTFVSCDDYDDDISSLQTQIDNLTAEKTALENKLNSGYLITSVESVADGVQLTFSDGSTQLVKNGKDAEPADVWTIDANGYWAKNGVATEYKAVPEDGKTPVIKVNDEGYWTVDGVSTGVKAKGDQGDQGDPGAPGDTPVIKVNDEGYWTVDGVSTGVKAKGDQGDPGKDGVYYVPNTTTGNFDKVENGVATDTGISYQAPNALTAVVAEDGTLTLSNGKDVNWSFNKAVITDLQKLIDSLYGQIQSIAFVPQYVDANNVAIVPAYGYVSPAGEELDIETPIQFLVKPAELAAKLPLLTENISLLGGKKLETRAKGDVITSKVDSIKVTDAENGIVTVYTAFQLDSITANRYPFALTVNARKTQDSIEISSDYFQVVARDLADATKALAPLAEVDAKDPATYYKLTNASKDPVALDAVAGVDTVDVYYNIKNEHAVATELKVNLKHGVVSLDEIGNGDLEIVKVYTDKGAAVALDIADSKKADDADGYTWKNYFTVTKTGVAVNFADGNAQPEAIGKEVKVVIADKNFGHTADGKNYVSTFEVVYRAVERVLELKFAQQTFSVVWGETIGTNVLGYANTPLIDAKPYGKTYTFALSDKDITNEASELESYGYTAAGAYNTLAKSLIANGHTSETSAIIETVAAGVGEVQYVAKYWAEYDSKAKTYTIYEVIVVGASADFGVEKAVEHKYTETYKEGGNTVFKFTFSEAGTYSYGDNDFYKKYTQRWTPQGEYTYLSANFNWADVRQHASDGDYSYDSISVTDAFANYIKYTSSAPKVSYIFTLNKKADATKKLYDLDKTTAALWNSDGTPATGSVKITMDDASKKGYLAIKNKVTANNGAIKVAYDDVELNVTAVTEAGHDTIIVTKDGLQAGPLDFKIQLTLPITESDVTVKDTTLANNLVNGVKIDLSKGVNATSTKCLTALEGDGVVFIKDGVLQTSDNVKGWGSKALTFKKTSAKNATGQDLPENQISVSEDGKLTITDVQNIKNQCTVVVTVTFEYKFATVSKDITVTIPAQGE